MRFEFEAPGYVVERWGDLLAHPFGRWQDIQVFDEGGLVAFAVQHERMVAARVDSARVREEGVFKEEEPKGEPVNPELLSLLLDNRSNAR